MSPHLRSLLEDAADDAGRPAMPDLQAIRAGGRRAVWRRRASVGGLGAGVTAVIATVAMALGGPNGIAPPPADEAEGQAVLAAAGLSEAALPLVDAIRSAGYDLDVGAASGGGAESAEGAGALSDAASTTVEVVRGETSGLVVVADFSAVPMLTGLVPRPKSQAVPGPACAGDAAVDRESDFRWEPCAVQSFEDGEIASSEGSGSGVDAVGAIFVRGDGSGFAVTLSTALSGGWFAYEPLPPTTTPLAALPLTAAQLVEVVATMAAFDEPLLAGFRAPDETAMPTEAPRAGETTAPDTGAGGDLPADCPAGVVLVRLADDAGQSVLVRTPDGRTHACSSVVGSLTFTDNQDLTDREAPTLDGDVGFFALAGSCIGLESCGPLLHYGAQPVPVGVARIRYETSDGVVTDAELADGFWLARILQPSSDDVSYLVVRAYDERGELLVEGDLYDVSSDWGTCTGPEPCAL